VPKRGTEDKTKAELLAETGWLVLGLESVLERDLRPTLWFMALPASVR
jgi:hypothetical protein